MNEGTLCRGTQCDLRAAWCIDPCGMKAVACNDRGVSDDSEGNGYYDEGKKSSNCGGSGWSL